MLKGTVIVESDCEHSRVFVSEADDPLRIINIRSIMLGPLIDSDGKLRGVVQLFNKIGPAVENETYVKEFKLLLPVIAEVIKKLDKLKQADRLVCSVGLRLKHLS